MITSLLNAKKITPEEADIYNLYQGNELGRRCLDRMMLETFMDEPQRTEFNGEGFAFYDGRRSIFRDITRTLKKIEIILREDANGKHDTTSDAAKRAEIIRGEV